MSNPALVIVCAVIMGLGATLAFDLWGLLLHRAFKIVPSNICLVGRWLQGMPAGKFRHANIATSPRKRAECTIGWIAHYLIGVTFAGIFVAAAGSSWLKQPTPFPAIGFGMVTVLAPFMIMQPAMGLGMAAFRTPNPAQARLRSLMNHTAFGVGLYLFGLLVNRWI